MNLVFVTLVNTTLVLVTLVLMALPFEARIKHWDLAIASGSLLTFNLLLLTAVIQ